MTVAELRAECLARALNDEGLKKDLQQNLKEQLKGLINEQDKSTEEIDLPQTLLDTLTELSGILYARPEERCTRGILRVHNQTFLHAIVCEEVIGKPQILSEKTFYW
ncbi:unnamed protein product [Porites lobata]|uniref:SAP domain-containing protein n=1 Tax=Porites lobata TaxID=104759 RepID=A0ABN8PC65_9CNID|nr:unnamed protein product [Porites lobata]